MIGRNTEDSPEFTTILTNRVFTVSERTLMHQNAVILFGRTLQFERSNPDEPYAALPWEDVDALSMAILGDVIEHSLQACNADVLFYRNPAEYSDEFLRPFRNRLKCFDLKDGSITSQVQGAVEQAFALHYSRVVIVLENSPLISPTLLSGIFSQLGCEDDCIVVGPTLDAQVYLVGLKSRHDVLFEAGGPDLFSKPKRFLEGVCRESAVVVPAQTQYLLNSGSRLARLRCDVEAINESNSGFPRRTISVFKSFDKKYKQSKTSR